jgi:TolA-binding protein
LALSRHQRMSMEEFGMQGMDRMKHFWDVYQKVIIGVGGAIIAVVIVAVFTLRARDEANSTAAGRLAEASLQYWQGNYQASLSAAQQVAGQYGGTPAGKDAWRLAEDDQYWLGQFKDAATSYRKYLEHAKPGMLSDAARRSLAYALESDRQFDEASKIFLDIAPRLDRESGADCLMGAARCARASGKNAEAADLYRRVVDEFGDTGPARMARVYQAEMGVARLR